MSFAARSFDAGVAEGIKREQMATRVHGLDSEVKPDRRAELLELASRIQVSRPNASAQTCVSMAAAIIAEVDRVSGEGKP